MPAPGHSTSLSRRCRHYTKLPNPLLGLSINLLPENSSGPTVCVQEEDENKGDADEEHKAKEEDNDEDDED